MKNPEVQLVRPPVPVPRAAAGYGLFGCTRYRAFAFFTHTSPPFVVRTDAPCCKQYRASVPICLQCISKIKDVAVGGGSGGIFFCELNSMSPQRNLSAPIVLAEPRVGAPLYYRGSRIADKLLVSLWWRREADKALFSTVSQKKIPPDPPALFLR